jgi:TfoX/Sxy family transcriptional regulator of competence genes
MQDDSVANDKGSNLPNRGGQCQAHSEVAGPRGKAPPIWRCFRMRCVAYDEDLADRIRQLVSGEESLTERKMFGGLAFLISGNMAISASGQGGVLVRVDPRETDNLVSSSKAQIAVMGGRQMDGWLRVAPEHVRTKPQLAKWVTIGTTYARSLPPK